MMMKREGVPADFWGNLAKDKISWLAPFRDVLDDSKAPHYKWFVGGKLNASMQCVDRHLATKSEQPAIIWESESGETTTVTYGDLSVHVNKFANLLKRTFHVKSGDRVVIYMPMIPEAIYAMLACARIGAVHVVVFGGFSAEALHERIDSTNATLVITADGGYRHGKPYMLKPTVDEALDTIKKRLIPQLIVTHNNEPVQLREQGDYLYNQLIESQSSTCTAKSMDSEAPLFILHTSGSTGRPKGIIHTTAGYMLWAQYTTELSFSLTPSDIFWCTADIGWITGHTYTVYGPLSVGATIVIYEGTLDYPTPDRWWQIIEKHRVTQFYTAPTAIRILKKLSPEGPDRYDLSSLRVLGSVGEPINPTAWQWFKERVGGGTCAVIDTWWQTETGGHIIAPVLPHSPQKPGVAATPLPGISVEILTKDGESVEPGERGLLCITQPWPSMLRGIWGDETRFKNAYFEKINTGGAPIYFSGDVAYYDEDGDIVIIGRADDVINTAGHRVGTAELESALARHSDVVEAAVVSVPHEVVGEAIIAFVVVHPHSTMPHSTMHIDLNIILKKAVGGIVKVERLIIVPELPKTRSGKILRRTLRSIANREQINDDLSTIEKPGVISEITSINNQSASTTD